MTDYDRDPEALAWARTKVQEVVDKAEACAANTRLSDQAREGWRQTAAFIRHELVRRDGAAYASFDERWPRLVNSGPAATEATQHGYCPACGRGDCAPTADQYEQQRVQTEEWRRKAVSRALTISRLRGTIDALIDLADDNVTDQTPWGDGYRAGNTDLREVLREYGHLDSETAPAAAPPAAPDNRPTVAECRDADRAHWNDKHAEEQP
ncbi:hypothetical protein ACFYNA_15465 [Streptomyces sp. NPDC006640]|uniref:hypothetical protein n=1 Tax=Streptomyces sp. NPDC006640 TaxID=3364754 RepID=UPI0036B7C3F1